MYVRSIRFAFQGAFEKLLGRNVFAAVQFNYAAIIKRIGIARRAQLGAQPGLRNR